MSTAVAQTGAQQGLGVPHQVSPTPTLRSDDHTFSTYPTLTNADGSPGKEGFSPGLPAESTLGKVEQERIAEGKADGFHDSEAAKALSSLPAGRKSILLLCFCLA